MFCTQLNVSFLCSILIVCIATVVIIFCVLKKKNFFFFLFLNILYQIIASSFAISYLYDLFRKLWYSISTSIFLDRQI